jgi:hypothetical protein
MRCRLAVAALLPFQNSAFRSLLTGERSVETAQASGICVCAKERVRLGAVHAHPTTLFDSNYLGENIYIGDPGFAALLVRGF